MNRTVRAATAALVTAGLLCAVAGLAWAQSADPRAGQIKSRLERLGFKVSEVSFAPAKGPAPPVWVAVAAAKYTQPTWTRITDQSLDMWNVMFSLIRKDDPKTLVVSAQDWQTYRLFLSTELRHLTAFDRSAATARTDAEKVKGVQILQKTIVFRVFDLKKQQLVDPATFTNAFLKP